MKKILVGLVLCMLITSCGVGIYSTINRRPKPWLHPFVLDQYTGIDTLIRIDGYYLTSDENKVITAILFYDNGLCYALGSNIATSLQNSSVLDTLFSNKLFYHKNKNVFYKDNSSWGTYQINDDTIKAYVLDNVYGTFETRKYVVTSVFVILPDRKIRQVYTAKSSKEWPHEKTLEVEPAEFHPLDDIKDYTQCPHLKKDWFYKKDKVD